MAVGKPRGGSFLNKPPRAQLTKTTKMTKTIKATTEGPQAKTGEAALVPSHLEHGAARAGSDGAVEPVNRQGPEEAEVVAAGGDTRPHAVCPEGGLTAAGGASPKPGRAPKGYTPYTVVARDAVVRWLKSRQAAKNAAEAAEARKKTAAAAMGAALEQVRVDRASKRAAEAADLRERVLAGSKAKAKAARKSGIGATATRLTAEETRAAVEKLLAVRQAMMA